MKAPQTLRSFLRASPTTRRMALEAVLLIALARTLVVFVPMRHWRARLHTSAPTKAAASQAGALDSEATAEAGTVVRLVDRVARRMPFDASCLARAMAAQWMLRRRGIASHLQLGALRRPDHTVALHAWLTVAGRCVVGGGPRVELYAALSPSGDPEGRPAER